MGCSDFGCGSKTVYLSALPNDQEDYKRNVILSGAVVASHQDSWSKMNLDPVEVSTHDKTV